MAATALALRAPGITAPAPRIVPKEERVVHDTIIIWPERVMDWARPKFQRPLNINAPKVIELARAMMREAAEDKERMCTIPDTLTFGRFDGEDYLLDGQHRVLGSFALASGVRAPAGASELLTEGGVRALCALAQVKIIPFGSMAEMGAAFVQLNDKLVQLKADDLLRGLEDTNTFLRDIREACPFVGYEKNRGTKGQIMISMSAAIRTWFGSGGSPTTGPECSRAASYLSPGDTANIIAFFSACAAAGWVDVDYPRLWSTLNIGINMWLWRKLVLGTANKFHGGGDFMKLSAAQYTECMKELKNVPYSKFLGSRGLRYQDKLPTYEMIQKLFLQALARMKILGPKFPAPQGWGHED